MYRYALLAGGVALAAIAIVHPPPRPQVPVSSSSPPALARLQPSMTPRRTAVPRCRAWRTRRASRPRARKRRRRAVAIVDVNVADAQALAAVPGVGPAIAERIVEIREREGAYASLDELLDVAGMNAGRLERARPYLRL